MLATTAPRTTGPDGGFVTTVPETTVELAGGADIDAILAGSPVEGDDDLLEG